PMHRKLVTLAAVLLVSTGLSGAAATPRLTLAVRTPVAPAADAGGLQLLVLGTLTAKPDLAGMEDASPWLLGSATLRLEAAVVAGESNPFGLAAGARVDGLVLSVQLVRSDDGAVWNVARAESIPGPRGPHYESTLILDRPGLYSALVSVQPGGAVAALGGAGAPAG